MESRTAVPGDGGRSPIEIRQHEAPMTYLRMIRIIIPVLAGLALLGGAVAAISTSAFISRAKSTTGTIISSGKMTSDDGEVLHRPTFVFTVSGREHTVTPRSYVAPSPGDVGDTVPILYDPRDPRRASIDSFVYTWSVSVVLIGLGLAFGTIHFALNFAGRLTGFRTPDGGEPSNVRADWK